MISRDDTTGHGVGVDVLHRTVQQTLGASRCCDLEVQKAHVSVSSCINQVLVLYTTPGAQPGRLA
jgi:hypothetical protein